MERSIFQDLNNEVVCMVSGSYPAEGLLAVEQRPILGIKPLPELEDRFLTHPIHMQREYIRAMRRALRGMKLKPRIDFMQAHWPDRTPIDGIRDLTVEQLAQLPMMTKRAAEQVARLVA